MNDTTSEYQVLSFTNITNGSEGYPVQEGTLSVATVVTLTFLNCFCHVIGVFGNGLVLLVITRTSTLRSVPDYLISSLSLADLLVTAIYVPLFISKIVCYQEIKKHEEFKATMSFIGHLALLASITSILGITIDRFIAIQWPLRYPKLITKTFAYKFVALAWFISTSMSTCYAFFDTNHVFLWSYCLLLLVSIILMYSYILKIALAQRKRLYAIKYREERHQMRQTTNAHVQGTAYKAMKDRKAVKTFGIVIGVFVVTWTPLLAYTLIASQTKSWFLEGFLWVGAISIWNSFINPYIYFARSKRYRSMAYKMLGLRQDHRSRRISSEVTKALTVKYE